MRRAGPSDQMLLGSEGGASGSIGTPASAPEDTCSVHRGGHRGTPCCGSDEQSLRGAAMKTIQPPERAMAPAVALRDVCKVHGQGDGAVVALDGISVALSPVRSPPSWARRGPGRARS